MTTFKEYPKLIRRIGTFSIPVSLIQDNPKAASTILSTVIPVRAEQMWVNDTIEYVGISNYFEHVDIGGVPPKYKAILEDQSVRWEKQD